jgi:uncharacterized membrane protein
VNKRLIGVDVLRGVAIVLMVVFHFCYDLNHFGFINIEIVRGDFWLYFRTLIVTIFLFVVGVSLALAHRDGIDWQKVKSRALILFVASLMVTVATYIIFPRAWVYFGVLHAIWLFSLLGLFFLKRGYLALLLGVGIIVLYKYFGVTMHPLYLLLQAPLSLPRFTVDLVPLFPWFGVVLLGIALVEFRMERVVFDNRLFTSGSEVHKKLALAGRHALAIYLLHQPVLFSLVWVATFL